MVEKKFEYHPFVTNRGGGNFSYSPFLLPLFFLASFFIPPLGGSVEMKALETGLAEHIETSL